MYSFIVSENLLIKVCNIIFLWIRLRFHHFEVTKLYIYRKNVEIGLGVTGPCKVIDSGERTSRRKIKYPFI